MPCQSPCTNLGSRSEIMIVGKPQSAVNQNVMTDLALTEPIDRRPMVTVMETTGRGVVCDRGRARRTNSDIVFATNMNRATG